MIVDLLSDYTIRNVAAGAALLGLTSGVLGCFAVLRRQSLLGDMISHAALPGICLGFLVAGTRDLPTILAGALLTGALAALAMLVLTRQTRLKTDAGLGITLSVFFAAGIVLLTFIQGTGNASQGGLESFLFGQAAAILRSDLWIMGAIALLSCGLVLAFWKEFKLVSFDPVFARTIGFPVAAIEAALTVMIALAVAIGLQTVGVVLMAAMVIAPAAAARQWSRRLEGMVVLSALFGIAAGVAGAVVSALRPGLATGPLIILAASAIVAVSLLFAPRRGLLFEAVRRGRDRATLSRRQVLATLHGLARGHGDPAFRAEEGSVDAYHGVATRRVLQRLERSGLVRRARRGPAGALHWELTASGFAEAERVVAQIGGGAR